MVMCLPCLVTGRLSLDVNLRAKEGGKEKTGDSETALRSLASSPSRGPLRFVTSHSRFVLAFVLRPGPDCSNRVKINHG